MVDESDSIHFCIDTCITICGIAARQAVSLRPNRSAIHPETTFPTKPPAQRNAPIHEASSDEIGPLGSGESDDCRIGSEGEVHPQHRP